MYGMSEHDSFEDRLRAMADQVSQAVRRLSEVDRELAEKYGIDTEQVRAFADAAGQWLNDHLSSGEPLFGHDRHENPDRTTDAARADRDAREERSTGPGRVSGKPGPHPLDLPTDQQGLALSALDSGRWTVSPGSNQLIGSGEGPPPADAADLVGDLRSRDWISTDGALTLVGRRALDRWSRTAEDPGRPAPESEAPPA